MLGAWREGDGVKAATPNGFRDILPTEARARERISGIVRECFSAHGYEPIETPLLETRSALERGGEIQDSPFQLSLAVGHVPGQITRSIAAISAVRSLSENAYPVLYG